MEVMQVLRMNQGEGETSYAKNSDTQKNIICLGNLVIKDAVIKLLINKFSDDIMGIADLGCSSGPNTLFAVSEIMGSVRSICDQMGCPVPDFRVSLNDLPGNDFNGIFVSLPAFYQKLEQENGIGSNKCFISGIPGSFYGRLFPKNSLHFVHSSSSLHWLSQVPLALDQKTNLALNKGKLYLSKTSSASVAKAYREQFENDFSLFLKSRSIEIVPGGRLVLSFMGRTSLDPCGDGNWYHWELLANALMSMAHDGLIDEKKIDTFNAPYYTPCAEEVEMEVAKEGSFVLDQLELFEFDWVEGCGQSNDNELSSGERVGKMVRAVVESMLESHFGRELNMDELMTRYAKLMDDYLSQTKGKSVNLVISLVRKD